MLKINSLLLIYKCLAAFVAPFIMVFQLLRRKKPPYGTRAIEFLGFVPKINYQNPLWFHTVSVGESMGAIPLIRELAISNPNLNIVVTTSTTTARELYRKMPPNVTHLYAPLDSVCAVKRFISRVNPRGLVIMETELWPNLLSALHKRSIPVMLINARLSERSAGRYRKLGKVFTAAVGQHLSYLCCQTERDCENFISLGIDKSKTLVTGSLKFDVKTDSRFNDSINHFKILIHNRPVLAVASTHEGEEEQVLDIYKKLQSSLPELLLILIPRHPERFDKIYTLCKESGFNTAKRSLNNFTSDTEILLGDSMGELPFYFGCSTVVLMGGSLVDIGGHNPLEAIACRRTVVSGPYVRNFKKIFTDLEMQKASQCVSISELPSVLLDLLKDADKRNSMCLHATNFLEKNSGATSKTIQSIQKVIEL